VGFFALDVNDEPNPAGLVFELRIIETLFGRQASPAPIFDLASNV
jgi:hypothetical protein